MTGPLSQIDPVLLFAFGAGAFIAVWSLVMVSGFLPRANGPVAARGALGAGLVYSTCVLTAALIVGLVLIAIRLPVAVSIIAAGMAVLAGPFLAQPLPSWVRETRLGLSGVMMICLGTLIALSPMITF